MIKVQQVDDATLVEACAQFLGKVPPAKIAEALSEALGRKVSREDIYPLIREAIRRKYFLLIPPLSEVMSQRIADRYLRSQDKDRIHVVSVRGSSARDLVPARAADLILKRIREVARTKKGDEPVHIGFGGGGTIMLVSQNLAARLRSEKEKLPPLALHVLTSGFSIERPKTAPITFLGYFTEVPTSIEYFGLFAPPVVKTVNYQILRENVGVEESLRRAQDIDIVVTSLASSNDPHGELNEFMELTADATRQDLTALRNNGWLGDLCYQPYGKDGPITDIELRMKTLSLFELDELRDLAAIPDKHVIVVGAPCGICQATKVQALRPLLESAKMRVWTDLVLDLETATELLD